MAVENDTNQTPGRGTTFETLAVCGFIFGLFAIVAAVFAVGLAARAVSEAGSGGGGTSGSEAAAGGGASSGGGAASTSEVSLGEFFIKPAEATVSSSTELTVKNTGTIDHDLTVEGGNKTEMLAAGKEGKLDFKGLKPGKYKWFCSVPGHEAAGMKGTVTVQ